MKRNKGVAPAGDILEKALISAGQPNLVTFARIMRGWPAIVGEQLSKVSHPGDLSKRELTIWVKEPVWVDSLMYMKNELLRNINRYLAADKIGSVRVVRKKWEEKDEIKEVADSVQLMEPLSKEVIREAENVTAAVEDPELRSSLKRIMLKSLVAKKRKG